MQSYGRVGVNEFTYVSPRGSPVVDYVLTPYEQLQDVSDFKVILMSDLATEMNMDGNSKIRDNSLLTWFAPIKPHTIVNTDTTPMSHIRSYYDTSHYFNSFLLDDQASIHVQSTIDKINVTHAYSTFLEMLSKDIDLHFSPNIT